MLVRTEAALARLLRGKVESRARKVGKWKEAG